MKRIALNMLIVLGLIAITNSNVLAHVKVGSRVQMLNKHKAFSQYDFYYTAQPDFSYFIDGPNPDYYAILLSSAVWSVDSTTPLETIDITFRIFRTGDDPSTGSTLTRTYTYSGLDSFDIKQGISGNSAANNNGTFDVVTAGEWIANGGTFSIEVVSAVGETSLVNYNIVAN
jgi:hypothetical protein